MATYRAYPYPVLGNDDDITDGNFEFSMEYTIGYDVVSIDCRFEVNHETIESLISEKKAVFVSEIVCPATFYRKAFKSSTPELNKNINADDLRGRVTVESYICASEEIEDYDPVGTHPDLQGYTANVKTGEILAFGGTAPFIAEKEFDPLKTPVSSFMKIQSKTALREHITVAYETDRILIQLAKEDYDLYLDIKGSASANLHSSVVLPVLIDALYLVSKNSEDYGDCLWFSKLKQICDESGYDINSPFETAQKILQMPISRSFRNTKELIYSD